MAARTVATTDTIENFRTKFNSLSETDIGDLTGLTTTNKSSVVAAINEVVGGVNNFTIRDSSSTTQTIQGGDTLNFVGSGGINVTVSADDTVTISGAGVGGSDLVTTDGEQTLINKTINSSSNTITISGSEATLSNIANASLANSDITIGSTSINLGATSTTISGLTSLQTESLSNSSGNLEVDSATNILEIKGDGSSVVGQLQLNCHVNTHGQIVASQPHSEAATNTLTLPGGNTIGNSDATLLSDTGNQTVTNKTINSSSNTITISGSEATLSNIANASLTNSSFTLNGVSINLGDTTEISAGTDWQTGVVADGSTVTAAAAGEGYFIDTTSFAHTLQLPASPTIGDEISIIDVAGTFDTNNLTVDRNGKPIQGSAANLTVSVERAGFTLVFYNDTQGWVLKDK